MKLKKVEISAFRIYNEPDYSTFDFSQPEGAVADFVSLYAPNGFGKTSFYDAVEWGITGSVNRFLFKHKEAKNLSNSQFVKNDVTLPLLRNDKLERDTYVNVISDSNGVIGEQKLSKDGHNVELSFQETKPHQFHKVILSQEWISGFLTERDGEFRYKKFMATPELSKYDDYFSNLKHLLSRHDTVENEIRAEINKLKDKVKEVEDENLLNTINNRINILREEYSENELEVITIETTKNEIIKLEDFIARRIQYYQNRIEICSDNLEQLRIAITGKDDLMSLNSYAKEKKNINRILEEKSQISNLLEKFKELERLKNKVENITIKKGSLIKEREGLESFLLMFETYKKTQESIQSKRASKIENDKKITVLKGKESILRRQESDFNAEIKSLFKDIQDNEDKQKKIPGLQKEISQTDEKVNQIEKNISDLKNKIQLLNEELKLPQAQLSKLEKAQERLGQNNYEQPDFDDRQDLFKVVNQLEQLHKGVLIKNEELQVLDKKIEEQNSLNTTIEEFIKRGLAIVREKQESSSCPLCNHDYRSFDQLVTVISNNNALNDALKDLLNQKQKLIQETNDFNKKVIELKEQLINYYKSKSRILKIEIIQRQNEITKSIDDLRQFKDQLSGVKSNKLELLNDLSGLSLEDYQEELKKSLQIYKKSIDDLNVKLKIIVGDRKLKIEDIEKLQSQLKILEDEFDYLQANEDYNILSNYFEKKHPEAEPNKSLIENEIEEIKGLINEQNTSIAELSEKSLLLNNELIGQKKQSLQIRLGEIEAKKTSIEESLNRYKVFLQSNFQLNIEDLNKKEIQDFFENNQNENRANRDKAKHIVDEYSLLEKNADGLHDFLQSEKNKKLVAEKENELSFLVKKVKPEIENERSRVQKFIKERIKEFFYSDLIDTLYNKIDPHPDFKEVSFVANLEGEPRLDVFVKNKNSKEIIPNLYFSTAQINVLSLSIFLASALKSAEYDCIFIDDPIQSMDSINILSTIDLLRNICVQHNKQIIISTHDHNFHKLLKKKIPSNIFNSKFLKLETFGRVVVDS